MDTPQGCEDEGCTWNTDYRKDCVQSKQTTSSSCDPEYDKIPCKELEFDCHEDDDTCACETYEKNCAEYDEEYSQIYKGDLTTTPKPTTTTTRGICGDGVVQSWEECDDGNTVTEECVLGESCTVCAANCKEKTY